MTKTDYVRGERVEVYEGTSWKPAFFLANDISAYDGDDYATGVVLMKASEQYDSTSYKMFEFEDIRPFEPQTLEDRVAAIEAKLGL